MDLSIVVPVFNEEESLPELTTRIEGVCNSAKISFEIYLLMMAAGIIVEDN